MTEMGKKYTFDELKYNKCQTVKILRINRNENNIFSYWQPPAKSNPIRIIDLKDDTSETHSQHKRQVCI